MIGGFLKKFREADYSGKKAREAEPADATPPDENAEGTSRIISLSDDEMQAFQGSSPGEDVSCEVHGKLEEDGHFHVTSVEPLNQDKGYGSEQEMAGQVAQRVTPTVQLSPS